MVKKAPTEQRPNAINTDVKKCRFAPLLHTGYGERWAS